ncbi:MAG TPA: Hsp20/alpha crystallin family protein [Candidatus Angelobacter sp.]|nr:Hsp20/alpha crystallin family protein [Candidatus Angelobacter sp.]
MKETTIEKSYKPLPVPFEDFEEFNTPMQEFFDLVARRPFELLGATPRFFTRELENWFKPEPELFRPVNLKLFETEEALLVRAEVPGFTEKELDVHVEPWRLILTGKKEFKEEKKEPAPLYKEKMSQIYRTVKFPMEIRPEEVKAVLKNGVLELTLPKAEVVKKVHVEVKGS